MQSPAKRTEPLNTYRSLENKPTAGFITAIRDSFRLASADTVIKLLPFEHSNLVLPVSLSSSQLTDMEK